MSVLLVVAGAVIVFGIGWLVGRAGRSVGVGPDLELSAAEPIADEPPPISFADLLDEHPTGVVVADADGVIGLRNSAARAMSGTHVGVLLDEAIERHLDTSRLGNPSDEMLEMYGPPKSVFVVAARPLPDGGSVAFVEDISERRRVEQIRTDFVANISHELKTPVGAMSVLAEMLEAETDPETIHRVVLRIMSEAQRASRTLDDLMELSMIELGGDQAAEPVCVTDVIRAAAERVTEMAAQRNIGISTLDALGTDGVRSDSLVIDGDRRQLVSAVGNLVENAVKYSEPGGVVQIWVNHHADLVEIVVVDQGVGIPQRDLDRVFERFYRVDRARSRATGGTGLGLSIVRHVATRHGGEVVVSSIEGEGSTFTLRLPARRDTDAGHGPEVVRAPAAESTTGASEGVA
jgi:two-component system sensor histidine kinase SenX3